MSSIHTLKNSGSHIYCDMDGVLVNFSRGAYDLFGRLFFGSEATHVNEEVVNYLESVGSNISNMNFSSEEFRYALYSAIGESPGEFFAKLDPHNDGIHFLWSYINKIGLPVSILTAPINNNIPNVGMTAEAGKKAWCDKWLTPRPFNVYVTPAKLKPYFAVNKQTGAPNILIDDRKSTIDAWINRGGIGFLHVPGRGVDTANSINRELYNFIMP